MNKNSKPRQSWRFMNRDGTLNVERIGVRRAFYTDTYHSLLSLKWGKFMGYLVGYYFVVNCFFALAYMACGPQALEGSRTDSFAAHFVDAFFFSVQTFATIGYGKITPSGIAANLVVTFEALVGLLGLALATGLLFARFSKPTAKVVFSHSALMTKQDGIPCLIFRVANER
ncbi:MAG: ion channel, partial [Bdellovibrionota bacterium]